MNIDATVLHATGKGAVVGYDDDDDDEGEDDDKRNDQMIGSVAPSSCTVEEKGRMMIKATIR